MRLSEAVRTEDWGPPSNLPVDCVDWRDCLCCCSSLSHLTSPHPHCPSLTQALAALAACLNTAQCQVSPNLPTARATSWPGLSIPAGKDSSVAPQSTVHRVNTKYCLSVVWWGVVRGGGEHCNDHYYNPDNSDHWHDKYQHLNIVFQAGLEQRPAWWWRWLDWLSEEREDCTSLPCPSSACSNWSTLNPPACRIYFSLQSWASPGRALIVTKYYSNLPQGTMKWSYWDS